MSDEKQFKKWQWISARIEKASNDHRPESHKLFVDTISCEGNPLSTKDGWKARLEQLANIPIFDEFATLEDARVSSGITLGILQPSRILALDITPSDKPEWTQGERHKLVQHERQGGLFDDADAARIATLRKVPFDFHYRYACGVGDEAKQHRHKIADWEAGALYWTCRQRYGDKWEVPFRAKLEQTLPATNLMFLMGTIHRFPNQWLIVSLIYPPKLPNGQLRQKSLFDPPNA